MIGGFFSWWSRSLAACVPGWLSRLLQPRSWRIHWPTDRPLSREQRRAIRRARRLDVMLPEDLAPTRRLSLPAAAGGDIEAAARLQLEELTPFHASDLCIACAPVGSGGAEDRLLVELTATPKRVVETITDTVAGLGAKVDRIRSATTGQALWRRPWPRVAWLPAIVLFGCAIGMAAAAGMLHQRQLDTQIERLERRVAVERRQAIKAQKLLREQRQAQAAGLDILDALRQSGARLEILEELARRTDDTIWFTKIAMEGTELRLSGIATGTAAPISELERSPKLTNLRAVSATVADPRLGGNRFEVRADILRPVEAAR